MFVDKPIALEIDDAEAMIAACEAAGVKLAVGASSRFLRGHRVCRGLLDRGELGNLAIVETNYSNQRGLFYTPDDWQWYATGSPGGPLMQVAIHQIDNFLYLFGPMKRVSAEFRKVMTKSEIPRRLRPMGRVPFRAVGDPRNQLHIAAHARRQIHLFHQCLRPPGEFLSRPLGRHHAAQERPERKGPVSPMRNIRALTT